jgi:hypothetical protein
VGWFELKTIQELKDELEFKEERISFWENYGCILSKDETDHKEARV